MPYGYLGQNTPNQTVSNSGVFSISDVASLEKQGKFGGSLELIAESTFTAEVNIDFTSIQQNIYDVHYYTISNGSVTVSLESFGLRFYESGVLESSLVYQLAYQNGNATGTFDETRITANDRLYASTAVLGSGTGDGIQAYGYIYNAGNSSKYTFLTMHSVGVDNTVTEFRFGGGVLPQASEVDGFRFFNASGNNMGGTIKLYGVKQL